MRKIKTPFDPEAVETLIEDYDVDGDLYDELGISSSRRSLDNEKIGYDEDRW